MTTMRWLLVLAAALPLAACTRAAPPDVRARVLEARAREGEYVLKQAFTLQDSFRARNGRYAASFDELREVGWEEPQGLRFHRPPRIVRADDDAVCISIQSAEPDGWTQHVNHSGVVQRGPCP